MEHDSDTQQLIAEVERLRAQVAALEQALGANLSNNCPTTQDSEERYRLLSELISDFAYLLRIAPDGSVTREWGVGAYDRITGYTLEERDAQGGWAFPIHPDDWKTFLEGFMRMARMRKPIEDIDFRIIHKSGEIRWVRASARPVWDQEGKRIIGVLGAGRDITERKQAEDTLKESEWKLRAIYEHTSVGVGLTAANRAALFVNPAYCKMVGYTFEEIVSLGINPTHPDDLSKDESLMDQIASGEIDSYQIEKRYITKSGQIIWAQIHRSCYREDTGQVRFFVAVVEDITERKQAEEQLKASLAEKEILLKEVHHRVKNNMQVISSLLRLQAASTADPQIQEYFLESQHRVRSMALVHEKLYQSASIAQINLADYIRDLIAMLVQSYGTYTEHVQLRLDVEPIIVGVDVAISCGLLLNELASNALKHAFPNGYSGTVHVSLRATQAPFIQLSISDDGIGLPNGFDHRSAKTLGMQLIQAFSRQIGATISISNNHPGTKIAVEFQRGGRT